MRHDQPHYVVKNNKLDPEHVDLVRRLLHGSLVCGDRSRTILCYLANKHPRVVHSPEIARMVFERPESGIHNFECVGAQNTVRVAVKRLRDSLTDHFDAGDGRSEQWKCILPIALPGQGSWLTFIDQDNLPGRTGMFWQAHMSLVVVKNIQIVTNEVLSYRDNQTNATIRFFNFNPSINDNAAALHALHSSLDPKAYKHMFSPEFIERPDLRASFLYTPAGEVEARYVIATWFANSAGFQTTRSVSSSPLNLQRTSPILLGSMRTNQHIKDFLGTALGQKVRYRLADTTYGTVEIHKPRKTEVALVKPFKPIVASSLLLLKSNPLDTAFVIVTRFPSEDGHGCTTIIESDYTRAIQSVAETLTEEELLKARMAVLRWKSIPSIFQILCSVKLSSLDRRAESAKIVCGWHL